MQQNQTVFNFQYGIGNQSNTRREEERNGGGGKVMEIKAPCGRPLGRTQKLQIGLQELVEKTYKAEEIAYFCFLYALSGKKIRFCMGKETRLWQEISAAFISLSHNRNNSQDPKSAYLLNSKEVICCVYG